MATISLLVLLLVSSSVFSSVQAGQDSWQLLIKNAGVSAMHMALFHTNKVVMFDRTDVGPSAIKLPNGVCRHDPKDFTLKVDCWAHSIELDLATTTIRPLEILTDSWCSSGALQADGSLLQTGGFNDGAFAVRHLGPLGTDNWQETEFGLSAPRWYASDQLLPDGTTIVVGGRAEFNYEFLPNSHGVTNLPFLQQTDDRCCENNLYPFTHLAADGNLFIFANQDSILLDWKSGKVIRNYPTLPGGPRNYPSSGSSVMLPIQAATGFTVSEVVICGGAPAGSSTKAGAAGIYLPALQTCGRMEITAVAPAWQIFNMPFGRVLGDMLILPTGEILIINGAQAGTAGWGNARDPAFSPVLYRPNTNTFATLSPTTIPRLYHSSANVLPSGKILVAGSNPNEGYAFTGVLYPTELRIEEYSPYYLNAAYNPQRPTITLIDNLAPGYDVPFTVTFVLDSAPVGVVFQLYAPPFTTHTFSQNQRLLILAAGPIVPGVGHFTSTITSPPSAVLAPAGYFLFNVVNAGIPSPAVWIHIG
ncbi:unnamed protein product [Sphagnum troendelagicum]|uniref:Glyoxal oxidase n=1 Tax=Sphagnum troendelagicum TaxID=128251 RepID=A0ABP0TUM7_9BRYO